MSFARAAARHVQQRSLASASSPSASSAVALRGIETRWCKLPEAEQGAIADRLAAAQRGDWKKMTLEEKRAAYYIAYGPYGARSPIDPALKYSVALWSSFFIGISYAGYLWWDTQKPEIRTMTPEWKAEENRRAIELKQNPYQGVYAEERKKNPNA